MLLNSLIIIDRYAIPSGSRYRTALHASVYILRTYIGRQMFIKHDTYTVYYILPAYVLGILGVGTLRRHDSDTDADTTRARVKIITKIKNVLH